MVPVFERLHELEILPNSSTVEGTVQNSRKLVDELCAIIANGFNDVLFDESASSLKTEPTVTETSVIGNEAKVADSTELDGTFHSTQISEIEGFETKAITEVPPKAIPHPTVQIGSGLPEYNRYTGPACHDPRTASQTEIANDLFNIVKTEGPVQVKRAFDIYLRSCGIKRMGHEIRDSLLAGVNSLKASRKISCHMYELDDDDLSDIIWIEGTPSEVVRRRGDRSLEEIPFGELYQIANFVAATRKVKIGSEDHMRSILETLDLKRLTANAESKLKRAIGGSFIVMFDNRNSYG
jgi:hypothetical protein